MKREHEALARFVDLELPTLNRNAILLWLTLHSWNERSECHVCEEALRKALDTMSDGDFATAMKTLVCRNLVDRTPYDFDAGEEWILEAVAPAWLSESVAD